MNHQKIYLAVSLPVLAAVLTLYWLKQRKKINDNEQLDKLSNSSNATEVKQLNDDTSNQATINNEPKDINKSTVESINNQTIGNESKDLSSNNLTCENLISEESSLDVSIDKPIDKIIDESFDQESCNQNNLTKLIEQSTVSKLDQSFIDSQSTAELLDKQNLSLKNNLSTDSIDDSISENRLTDSISEINLNNNDFKSKLIQQSPDCLENLKDNESIDLLNQINDEESTDKKPIVKLSIESLLLDRSSSNKSDPILDINENSTAGLNSSINETNDQTNNESLIEAEEAFETDLKTTSSSLNIENMNFTQQFSTNSTFESKDNTFATANDSSLNATINTSIGSTKDTILNLENCSIKTLCSSSNEESSSNDFKLDKDVTNGEETCDGQISNQSVKKVSNEEVKEDYLNEVICTNSISNNENSNEEDLNFKLVNEENSTLLNLTDRIAKSLTSITNEEHVHNEMFLNETEHDFKNDSKSEVVHQLVEEIKNKVSEQENKNESMKENESSDNSDDVLNKSEDDSICVTYDGPQITKLHHKTDSKTTESNSSNQIKIETEQATNAQTLDESDLEIVYDSNTNKQNVNGHHTQLKNQSQQNNNRQQNGNHSFHKQFHQQTSKETDDFLDNKTDYCFEIPKPLCGLLIGSKGSNIENIKRKTETKIWVIDHPTIPNLSLCFINGKTYQIENALSMIRQRFPQKRHPQLTLDPINPNLSESIPTCSYLPLPDGINVEVLLCDFITPGHVFLQQPTHPSYFHLQQLDDYMISTYEFNDQAPGIDEIGIGIICAVKRGDRWYRAIVTHVNQDECIVKLLDHGGFLTLPKTNLRQVQTNFMGLPFLAQECFLANIQPIDGVWSQESKEFFKEITQKQFLQSFTVSYIGSTEQRIPCVQLFRIVNNQLMNINEELCQRGYAVWVD